MSKSTNPKDHRLIFCISSGRAGSQYLARLLDTGRHVSSFHEPDPKMNGQPLHLINRFSLDQSYEVRKAKAEAIRRTLMFLPAGETYCETNHMFIKTFFDVVMDEFRNVEVIVLRRELPLVLKSFLELDYFVDLAGDATPDLFWPHWMSSPDAATAVLPLPKPADETDQAERCIAYLFDIEARAQRFHQEYPHVRVHEVRVELLNRYPYVYRFFSELRIRPTLKTGLVIGRKVNRRIDRKTDLKKSTSIEYCRRRISQYLDLLDERGIEAPRTLALKPTK